MEKKKKKSQTLEGLGFSSRERKGRGEQIFELGAPRV